MQIFWNNASDTQKGANMAPLSATYHGRITNNVDPLASYWA